MSEADITGTLHTVNNGWQERTKQLVHPDHFHVEIKPNQLLLDKLTTTERARLAGKILLVEEFASCMAAGMLKGTIKYPTDGYSLSGWFSSVLGEGADFANYIILAHKEFMEEHSAKVSK